MLLDFSGTGIIPNVLLDAAGPPLAESKDNAPPERMYGKSLENSCCVDLKRKILLIQIDSTVEWYGILFKFFLYSSSFLSYPLILSIC